MIQKEKKIKPGDLKLTSILKALGSKSKILHMWQAFSPQMASLKQIAIDK